MKKTIVGGLMLGFAITSCGRVEPESSNQKVVIDVPKDKVDPNDIKELIEGLSPYIVEGKNEVNIAEIASQVKVDGAFREIFDSIIASRDPLAQTECQGNKCKFTSSGSEYTFTVDQSVPVLGKPVITLGEKLEIYMEISADHQSFEVCRIDGVKVKVGLFKQNVDGALMELDGDELKTLKVDVGFGGTYPSETCMF